MLSSTKQTDVILFFLMFHAIFIRQGFSFLRPYYIEIPQPIYPPPNVLGPITEYHHRVPWPVHNSSFARNLPNDPVPLVIHTWAKPAGPPEGYKLENGTVIYYVSPPFGGIRALNPTHPSKVHATTPLSNSIADFDDTSTLSPGAVEVERLGLFEDPTRQSGYASPLGWTPPNVDITTPPATKDGIKDSNLPNALPLSAVDKSPVKTTESTLKIQVSDVPTLRPSSVNYNKSVTQTSARKTSAPTTETISGAIDTTTSRFPVSDSVKKFRRIVAQIRAIAKKELGTEKPKRRRS